MRKILAIAAAAALLAVPAVAQFANQPSPLSNYGITPVVSTAAESAHVLKATPGNLYTLYATNATSTAAFLVVVNATSTPSAGTITGVLACVPLPVSGTVALPINGVPPLYFSKGAVALITSAASCFTYTTGTVTAFISGSVS